MAGKAEERRNNIISTLVRAKEPISGSQLARQCGCSRQVIVTDIAILRAAGHNIVSTSTGYVLHSGHNISRVFKVHHEDSECAEELNLFVDCGGYVKDVFIYHKVYGVLRADLNIKSRLDVARFMKNIESGKSRLLSSTTSGYHYHTIYAESEEVLDLIQEKLSERGFLAKLQDYEPVNFWEK